MSIEDLTTWTLQNPDSVLSVTSTTATAASMDGDSSTIDQVYKDKGSGFYNGDFKFRVGPVNISTVSSNNSRFIPVGLGLSAVDNLTACQGSLNVVWVNTTTHPTLYLAEFNSTNQGLVPDNATTSATYQNTTVGLNTNFWLEFARTGTTASCKVYSDAFTTLLTTLSFTLTQSLNYEFVYVCATAPAGTGATISATVQNVDLSPGGGSNATITPTAGSETVTGNTPTVISATNTVLFPVTAERRIVLPTWRKAA